MRQLRSITYEVDLRPRTWSRAGYNGRSRVFYDKQAEDKLLFGFHIMAIHGDQPKFENMALHLDAKFILPAPLYKLKKHYKWVNVTPDIDNYCKFLLDTLQKNEIISNDALVVKLSAEKLYGKKPKTIFTISELHNVREGFEIEE